MTTEPTPDAVLLARELARIAANEFNLDYATSSIDALADSFAAHLAPVLAAAGETDLVLIWSNEHAAWWAPASCGYTKFRSAAGLYTRAQAEAIVAQANSHAKDDAVPDEAIVPATKEDRRRGRACYAAPV